MFNREDLSCLYGVIWGVDLPLTIAEPILEPIIEKGAN